MEILLVKDVKALSVEDAKLAHILLLKMCLTATMNNNFALIPSKNEIRMSFRRKKESFTARYCSVPNATGIRVSEIKP